MSPRRYLAALGLATVALATVGCGGSSKTTSTATNSAAATSPTSGSATATTGAPQGPALTRTVWLAKGNAICRRIETRLASTTVHNTSELEAVMPALATFEQAAVTRLEALTPPASYSGDWQQIVASLKTLAQDTANEAKDAQSGQLRLATSEIIAHKPAELQASSIAARDGLAACAQISRPRHG